MNLSPQAISDYRELLIANNQPIPETEEELALEAERALNFFALFASPVPIKDKNLLCDSELKTERKEVEAK